MIFLRGKKQPNSTSDYLKLRKHFFLVELKPLFRERFQGSQTQFQSKRIVMLWTDVYVTADLYQSKRSYKPRTDITKYTSCCLYVSSTLFFCIWSRYLKLELRKWSLIQMPLKKHSLYNLNWSCFEHTVACANITIPRCVTAVCLWKIIEKSVMGESFVFCPARLDSWCNSR